MSCLNLRELFKGRKVQAKVEPKRGPGRPPKRPRLDIESVMAASAAIAGQIVEVANEGKIVEAADEGQIVGFADDDQSFEVAEEPEPAAVEESALEVEESVPFNQLSPHDKKKQQIEWGKQGGQYGRLGGRPRGLSQGLGVLTQDACDVIVEQQSSPLSNRRPLSRVSRRDDSFGIVAKLEVCQKVKELRPSFESSGYIIEDVYAAVAKLTGREYKRVKLAAQDEDKWLLEKQRLQMGKGTKGTLRSPGQSKSFLQTMTVSRGLRAKGAGAKPDLPELYVKIREWFEKQRAAGRYVDANMLVMQFEYLMSLCKAQLKARVELTAQDAKKLKVIELKIPKMVVKSTRTYWAQRLSHECGATLLKPQRLLNLTYEEEEARLIATWQDFDYRMYNMCFGDLSWLNEQVHDPALFRENIKNTVISFSDQVPWWVKVKSARQLFASWELSSKAGKNKVEMMNTYRRESQVFKPGQGESFLEAVPSADGMSQLRGQAAENNDKYRITLELQQDLYNWFDKTKEPIVKHGKPLLILIGPHARLSNIGDDGRFIKDEQFEFLGKPRLRKAGASARGLMKSWVALRKNNPEAKKMLEYIDVMQQPAGFSDSIIAHWRIESLAAEHPQSLHVRDLNSSYLSPSARQASS